MIKSITVTNHLDESIKIALGSPGRSGFLIANIEGLGPAKATINSTEMASGDGSIFNSSRLEPRNIVISLFYDYDSSESIEDLRHKSYKYFPIKKKIKLVIETDRRSCEIEGYVESNEPMIFSPREGTQISILCPYPYFYSAGLDGISITEFGGVEGGFRFPFCNRSLSKPMLKFGIVTIRDKNNVPYYGDAEVGITMTITVLKKPGDISIVDSKNNIMKLRASIIEKITGDTINPGDIITISTLNSKKYVIIDKAGKIYNILNALDRNSKWFTLDRGDNLFSYSTAGGKVLFKIENRILYEGV